MARLNTYEKIEDGGYAMVYIPAALSPRVPRMEHFHAA
tara:strand:- start:1670 stop:1783 length:114 start_codon:yes stop_codon:yes gene_type:complete